MRILALCLLAASALAQQGTITFTNKIATFTNLEGRIFKDVQLVRADLDGLIWMQDVTSAGRICYTNLDPDVLESFGISSNRIAVALARAQHKAVARAQEQMAIAASARAKLGQAAKEAAQFQVNVTYAVGYGGSGSSKYIWALVENLTPKVVSARVNFQAYDQNGIRVEQPELLAWKVEPFGKDKLQTMVFKDAAVSFKVSKAESWEAGHEDDEPHHPARVKEVDPFSQAADAFRR